MHGPRWVPASTWQVRKQRATEASGAQKYTPLRATPQDGRRVTTRPGSPTTSAGTGKTLLSGNVAITTDSKVSRRGVTSFAMRDPSRGDNDTTDLKHRTSGTGMTFSDTDNIWGNNATTDTATAGSDTHCGLGLTWDYHKNTFGRNGIDNAGTTTYSRVHCSNNHVNAPWDDGCFCMTYGDGDGVTYLPLVAIDVAGHELTTV
jgi:Zn-dependent metalloprotease